MRRPSIEPIDWIRDTLDPNLRHLDEELDNGYLGTALAMLQCLPTTRPRESRGRVMLDSTNHASIVSIYGGNAETDSLASVVSQFVDGSEALRE